MGSRVIIVVLLACCLASMAFADSTTFSEEIGARVDQVKHGRQLTQFTLPGQCGFSPIVVVYNKQRPKDLDVIGEIWPIARFGDDQVEYIPKKNWACLKKVSAMPGTLIVYDDGNLGDMHEFSSIFQINGHFILKSAPSRSGPGLKNLYGFKSLRIVAQSFNILDMFDLDGLQGLERLTTVGQDIVLWNTAGIKTLKGLENINRIGQTLYLDNNRGLTSLEGLENLEQIGFDLFIKGNGQIKDMKPLKKLKKVFGNVIIDGNNALNTLEDFVLEEVGIGIEISNNKLLPNLRGFEALTEISGDLFVMRNPSLQSLDGVNNVTNIGLNLILSGNDMLDDLEGLGSCKKVSGLISIADNQSLKSLKGMKKIKTVGEDILIHRNPQLTTLEDLSVKVVGTNLGGNVIIEQNWQLVGFGDWPTILKEVRGGVRIVRNNEGIDQAAVAKITSKSVEA